jgi:hypothetical protein
MLDIPGHKEMQIKMTLDFTLFQKNGYHPEHKQQQMLMRR